MINALLLALLAIAGMVCGLVLLRVVKSPFAAAVAAIVLVGSGFLTAAWVLRGTPHGAAVHAWLGTAAVGLLAIGLLRRGPALRAMMVTTGITTLLLTGWSALIYPAQMAGMITSMAQGRPYCVLVNDVAVTRPVDLAFLTIEKVPDHDRLMRRGLWHRVPHVVLRESPVAPQDYLAGLALYPLPLWPGDGIVSEGAPQDYTTVACIPRIDGLQTPPRSHDGFLIASGQVLIPADLQARKEHDQYLYPTLRLHVPLTDFALGGLSADERAILWLPGSDHQHVWMTFTRQLAQLSWPKTILDKAITVMDGPDGLARFDEADTQFYLAFDAKGEARTEILCYPRDRADEVRPPLCVHRFIGPVLDTRTAGADPVEIMLRYPPSWLPYWTEIEATLTAQITRITITD